MKTLYTSKRISAESVQWKLMASSLRFEMVPNVDDYVSFDMNLLSPLGHNESTPSPSGSCILQKYPGLGVEI